MLEIQALLIFIVSLLKITAAGFNVAYRKETSANYTCGDPPETFFETQQGFLPDKDRVPLTCNASDPATSYPSENIVDGLLATHWQSKAGKDAVFITITLGQVPGSIIISS